MAGRILIFSFVLSLSAVYLLAGGTKLYALVNRSIPSNTIFYDVARGSIVLMFTIAAAEAILGLWLLSGKQSFAAAALSLAMCSAFAGVLARESRRETPRPCGCLDLGSMTSTNSSPRTAGLISPAVRVALMAGASLFLMFVSRPQRSTDDPSVSPALA